MFLIVLPCSSICCVGILCQTMSYAIQMMFSVQVLIMFVIKCSPVGDGWGGYFRNSSKSRISCRTNITFNRLMMTSWDSWYIVFRVVKNMFVFVANMAQFHISGHEIIAVFKEHQNGFLPPWIKITVNLRCNILFLSKIGLTKLGARCC